MKRSNLECETILVTNDKNLINKSLINDLVSISYDDFLIKLIKNPTDRRSLNIPEKNAKIATKIEEKQEDLNNMETLTQISHEPFTDQSLSLNEKDQIIYSRNFKKYLSKLVSFFLNFFFYFGVIKQFFLILFTVKCC